MFLPEGLEFVNGLGRQLAGEKRAHAKALVLTLPAWAFSVCSTNESTGIRRVRII
jgi:hypothetical protein